MEHFLLLKTGKEYFPLIEDVLQMLLGIHSVQEKENILLVRFSNGNKSEIIDTIHSLEEDLNTLISLYISTYDCLEEVNLIYSLFSKANHDTYDFKSLLIKSKRIKHSKDILEFILNKTGVTEEIILAMAKNDLNVSKTSSMIYMHRNTLLYKIDRLLQLKSFDLKSFYDVYILMKLIYS